MRQSSYVRCSERTGRRNQLLILIDSLDSWVKRMLFLSSVWRTWTRLHVAEHVRMSSEVMCFFLHNTFTCLNLNITLRYFVTSETAIFKEGRNIQTFSLGQDAKLFKYADSRIYKLWWHICWHQNLINHMFAGCLHSLIGSACRWIKWTEHAELSSKLTKAERHEENMQ